jgi:hypothetical protein
MIDFPYVLVKFLKITFTGNCVPVLDSSEYIPDCGGRIYAITMRMESINLRRGSEDMHRLSARQAETKNHLNFRLNEGAQCS